MPSLAVLLANPPGRQVVCAERIRHRRLANPRGPQQGHGLPAPAPRFLDAESLSRPSVHDFDRQSGAELPAAEQVKAQHRMASASVGAGAHYQDPQIIAAVSRDIGEPMRGQPVESLAPEQQLAARGN